MNLWLWIGLPLLFLLGIFLNAIKDMKRLEKQVPKFLDKVRPQAYDDDEDEYPAKPDEKRPAKDKPESPADKQPPQR
ncbi:hypothetical protein [Pseudaeromonas paramecii]|uniref:Uncharacterized protein n=1 Tax=Pseudaeromonas paramecii TaxID=2138166 RepID=A0ABP8Q8C6_9GAMM